MRQPVMLLSFRLGFALKVSFSHVAHTLLLCADDGTKTVGYDVAFNGIAGNNIKIYDFYDFPPLDF